MRLPFSIVIPVKDQHRSLELLLRCLECQSAPKDSFECIVVDDGSSDNTPEVLAKTWGIELRVLRQRTSIGRSDARNTGWRASRGDVILFLDADVLPSPGWLDALGSELRRWPLDVVAGSRFSLAIDPSDPALASRVSRHAGVNASQLFRGDPERQFEAIHRRASHGHYPTALCAELDAALVKLARRDPRHPVCAYSFVSCNVGVTRRALERTGGFDSFLRRNQDIELGLRLWESGCRFGTAPQARGYHLYHDATDRTLGAGERMAFLWRHPIRTVVAMYVWMLTRSGERPNPLPAPLDSVTNLATALRRDGDEVDRQIRGAYEEILDAGWRVTEREAIRYLCTERGVTPKRAHAAVRRAIRAGLVSVRQRGERLIDLHLTTNWVDRRGRLSVPTPAAGRPGGVTAHKREIGFVPCSGRYVAEFRWDGLDIEGPLSIDLPLPGADQAASHVRIAECEAFHVRGGREWPVLSCTIERPPTRVSRLVYHFELFRNAVGEGSFAAGADPSSYLDPTYAPADVEKAEALLERILGRETIAPVARVARIEAWLRSRVRYSANRFGDAWILDSGLGDHFQITRLFVNVCRLAGIPARERCGARLHPVDDGAGCKWSVGKTGRSPLSAAWAEVFLSGEGWCGHAFDGIVSGMTTLQDDGGRGRVPRRLPAADVASRIVGYPQEPRLRPAAAFVRTRHTMTCSLQ